MCTPPRSSPSHQALQAIVSMSREQIEPGTRLMLVALDRGIQIRQPFTEDAGTFTAAVRSLRPSPGQQRGEYRRVRGGGVPQLRRHGKRQRHGSRTGQGLPGARRSARPRWPLRGSRRSATTWPRCPGRKHLVFFSAGYAMRPSAMAAEIVDSACGSGPTGGSGRMVRHLHIAGRQ